MRVLVQTRSKRPVSHNLPKNWSPARSSNSGGSPTTRTRMHHSTQVATHRRNQSKCFPPRTPIEKRFLQVVGPGGFITIQDGNTQLKPWRGSRCGGRQLPRNSSLAPRRRSSYLYLVAQYRIVSEIVKRDVTVCIDGYLDPTPMSSVSAPQTTPPTARRRP